MLSSQDRHLVMEASKDDDILLSNETNEYANASTINDDGSNNVTIKVIKNKKPKTNKQKIDEANGVEPIKREKKSKKAKKEKVEKKYSIKIK